MTLHFTVAVAYSEAKGKFLYVYRTLRLTFEESGQNSKSSFRYRIRVSIHAKEFQFGQKVSIRFDSILATEWIFFDSIQQSDKFAACTLIFK